jgi:hypothetical protein
MCPKIRYDGYCTIFFWKLNRVIDREVAFRIGEGNSGRRQNGTFLIIIWSQYPMVVRDMSSCKRFLDNSNGSTQVYLLRTWHLVFSGSCSGPGPLISRIPYWNWNRNLHLLGLSKWIGSANGTRAKLNTNGNFRSTTAAQKCIQIGIVSQLEFATVPLTIGRSKYSPSISQGSTTKPPNSIRNCLWFWIQIEPYLIGPVWICL